jgi:hypothetical protein
MNGMFEMGMKSLRTLLVISIAFTLSACATKYVRVSDSIFSDQTGYSEVPVDTNAWEVMFAGNSATDPDLVDRYALYRAAELTINDGYDYFIVDKQPDSLTSLLLGPLENGVNFYPLHDPANRTFSTVTNPSHSRSVYTEVAYSETKTIRMYKGDTPTDNPSAYNAKSMLAVMGPTINK